MRPPPPLPPVPLRGSSLQTSVCVYSCSQTAPSDSIPAEVLTEVAAEVNPETRSVSTPGRVTPTCCLIRGRRGVSQREVTSTEVFRAPRPPVARGAPRCPCVPGPRMCGVRAPNAHGGFLVRSRYADSPLNNVTCTINTITETHSAPGGGKRTTCAHMLFPRSVFYFLICDNSNASA